MCAVAHVAYEVAYAWRGIEGVYFHVGIYVGRVECGVLKACLHFKVAHQSLVGWFYNFQGKGGHFSDQPNNDCGIAEPNLNPHFALNLHSHPCCQEWLLHCFLVCLLLRPTVTRHFHLK